MSLDDKIGRALVARRPEPARGYEERLRAATARPRSHAWKIAVASFAVTAAAIVAIVVATRDPTPRPDVTADQRAAPTEPPPDDRADPNPGEPTAPIADPAQPGDAAKADPLSDRYGVAGPGDAGAAQPLEAYQRLLDDNSAAIVAALKVDATNAAKLRDFGDELRKQRAQRAAEREVASIDLRRELSRVDIDAAKAAAHYDRVLAADVAIRKTELLARIAARALLTPAQRAMLETPPVPPPPARIDNPFAERSGRDDDLIETKGTLHLASKPAARIFLDGVDTGSSTPMILKVAAGKHKVTFVIGTDRYTFPATVTANQTTKLVKDLSGSTGRQDDLTNPFTAR